MSGLDYSDIAKRARDGAAFSNGTEFECWKPNWCDRCLRDAPFRTMGKGMGCPILAVALTTDKTPAEWMEQAPDEHGRVSLSDRYHCIEFRAPGGGGGEPRRKPEPPDMDGLFDRPDRKTRMYVQPQSVEVAS